MGTCTEDNNNSGHVHCTISGEIVAKASHNLTTLVTIWSMQPNSKGSQQMNSTNRKHKGFTSIELPVEHYLEGSVLC